MAWLLTMLQVQFSDVETGHASFPKVLDGVQSVSSIVYQCIYVQFPRVQFLDSRLNFISS